MPCNFNYSDSEIADILRQKAMNKIMNGEPKSIEDVKSRLQWFYNNFESRELPIEKFKSKNIPSKEGIARGYGIKGNQDFLIEETFTTEAAREFAKKKDKKTIEEINKRQDNVIKRETGVKVHLALQHAVYNLIKDKYKNRISTIDGITIKTKKQIASETNLPDFILNDIDKLANGMIKNIIAVQDKIDKSGNILIVPESILVRDALLAGTIDLVAVFSDMTYGTYDYKTLVPQSKSKERINNEGNIEYNITDPNWIAAYHYDDWNMQLPKANKVLENIVKLKRNRQSRIIPIHLEFAFDKNKKMTDRLIQFKSFENTSSFLDMIPIAEKTDNDSLNASIQKLYVLRNNIKRDLENLKPSNNRYSYVSNRLNKVNMILNKVLIRQDSRYLVNDYKNIIEKYAEIDEYGSLKSLKDTNNKESSSYLTLDQLQDLQKEIELFIDLISNTNNFFSYAIGATNEQMNESLNLRRTVADNANTLLIKIKEEVVSRLDLSERALARLKNMKNISWYHRQFDTFSEIQNPIFEKGFKDIQEKKDLTNIKLQKFREKLNKVDLGVQQWGHSHGYKGLQIYDVFIDKNTLHLHNKLTKSFLEKMSLAFEEKDRKFLLKYYKLKDNAKEIFEKHINNMKSYSIHNEIDEANYRERNSIDNALTDKNRFYYYFELKDKYKQNDSEIYSDEYKLIASNKALKDFYDFWGDTMKDCRHKLGFEGDYRKMPSNFVPYLRKEAAEALFQDGFFNVVKDNVYAMFNVTNDSTDYGDMYVQSKVDIDTGEILSDIPKFLINPIINRHGEMDKSLKSLDLGKVLYSMASVAYNYENLKEIEAEVNALIMLLEQPEYGVLQKKSIKGGPEIKLSGSASPLVELFKKHIKYAIYGIKTQDTEGSENLIKTIQTLDKIQMAATLGLAPKVQIAAVLAAKFNQFYESKKGFFFTKKQMVKAEMDLMQSNFSSKEGQVTLALINFLEPHELTTNQQLMRKFGKEKREKIGGNFITRLDDMNIPYVIFRKGTAWINSSVMLAMMDNYGISSTGKVRRLEVLPEGTKSLKESSRIENGNLVIDGIVDKDGNVNISAYTDFRSNIYAVAKGIHGEMRSEDINAVNMTFYGQLILRYKNWINPLVKERFFGMQYEKYKDTITIGKFNALWKADNLNEDEKQFVAYVKYIGLRMVKVGADIATFGMFKNASFFKASENRIRMLYEEFKQKNLDLDIFQEEEEEITYEQFKQYFEKQVRNSIVELRVMLGFIAFVSLLGAAFDDDDKEGVQIAKMSWANREVFRIANRVKRELLFFAGSQSLDIVVKNPIPVTGTIINGLNFINGVIDDTVEALTGEGHGKDKIKYKGPHYGLKMIPYHKIIKDIFEPSEVDKTSEF